MKMNGDTCASPPTCEPDDEPVMTQNWYDSTWELRRGLDVTEDLPAHLWPDGTACDTRAV
jgi:hypothetical protein